MTHKAKSVLRYLRASLLRGTGLLWLAKRRAAKHGVVVVMLHRVLDEEFPRSSSLPGILVRRQTFQQFVSWAAKSFEVVDLSKGIPDWTKAARSARIAFTFDDGWLDNYEIAAPVLFRNRTPTTIFVCPGLMGIPFPFWPERVSYLISRLRSISDINEVFPELSRLERSKTAEVAIERLKQMSPEGREEYVLRLEALPRLEDSGDTEHEPLNRTMTWEQVQGLHALGICIGSHTLSHPILTSVSEETVCRELVESRCQIEAGLKASCGMLAYPNGNHDEMTVRAAADAGYTVAFTTQRGLWTQQTDMLHVPRVNIFEQKLIGPSGRFSRAMAEYALFWKLESC